jgi:hypothetical protein
LRETCVIRQRPLAGTRGSGTPRWFDFAWYCFGEQLAQETNYSGSQNTATVWQMQSTAGNDYVSELLKRATK